MYSAHSKYVWVCQPNYWEFKKQSNLFGQKIVRMRVRERFLQIYGHSSTLRISPNPNQIFPKTFEDLTPRMKVDCFEGNLFNQAYFSKVNFGEVSFALILLEAIWVILLNGSSWPRPESCPSIRTAAFGLANTAKICCFHFADVITHNLMEFNYSTKKLMNKNFLLRRKLLKFIVGLTLLIEKWYKRSFRTIVEFI